jgi:hypothetical protein
LDDRGAEKARGEMSDVFVSYKHGDEARVHSLVSALEAEGLSVWWDRSLVAGENWQAEIESRLDAAKCVIVVWTRESVGLSGVFVRDEARRGGARGVLIPVLLDKVTPPLGFGETQAIDLTHWKSNRRDAFFRDLVGAVKSKMDGRPVPPPRGPMKRFVRRLSFSTVLMLIGGAFALNGFHSQEAVCSVPAISDACGTIGLGGQPTRSERLAWWARRPGNCEDLRKHAAAFPNGAYHNVAMAMLAAQQVTRTDVWVPSTRGPFPMYEPEKGSSVTKDAAKSAALVRAQKSAEAQCRLFAAGTLFRFKSAKAVPEDWDCDSSSTGVRCGLRFQTLCELEERKLEDRLTCGAQ